MASESMTFDVLERAVTGGVAAFRVVQRLQPAGGAGDKLFPPTYATGDNALRYAFETRRIDGADAQCVLVDSVASQANRMEEALLRAWEEKRADFPVIQIDFTGRADIQDLDHISTLQAPHRAFDALLRDSVDANGTLFRDTKLGHALTYVRLFNNDHGRRSMKPRTGSGLVSPAAGGRDGNEANEGRAAAPAVHR